MIMSIGRSRIGTISSGPMSLDDTSGFYQKKKKKKKKNLKFWHRSDEWLVNNTTYPTHSNNSSYVGYWGAISGQRVGPLFIISHTAYMNAASYKSVVKEVMSPYYHSLSGHNIFQQDEARYHTARSVLSFLKGQGVKVIK